MMARGESTARAHSRNPCPGHDSNTRHGFHFGFLLLYFLRESPRATALSVHTQRYAHPRTGCAIRGAWYSHGQWQGIYQGGIV
jgi:hypothetical protein